jgi:hypothetical protein
MGDRYYLSSQHATSESEHHDIRIPIKTKMIGILRFHFLLFILRERERRAPFAFFLLPCIPSLPYLPTYLDKKNPEG